MTISVGALIVAYHALIIIGFTLQVMGVLMEVLIDRRATAGRDVIAVVLALAMAIETATLGHEGIGGLGIAICFMFVALSAIGPFIVRTFSPVAGVAVVSGRCVAGGAKIVPIIVVRFVETVVASAREEEDGVVSDHRLHREEIATAVRVMTGVTRFGKLTLR